MLLMCHLLTPPNIFSIFAIDPIPILGRMYICFYLYDVCALPFLAGGLLLLLSDLRTVNGLTFQSVC